MKNDFFTRRFRHLLDAVAPGARDSVESRFLSLVWQPRAAAAGFKALRRRALAAPLTAQAIEEAAAEAAAPLAGLTTTHVLSAVFALPKKSFHDRSAALNDLEAAGAFDSLSRFVLIDDEEVLDIAAEALVRPSISSFNSVWEPLMGDVFTTRLSPSVEVIQSKKEADAAKEVAQRRGISIDRPDRFLIRNGQIIAHVELKGTSERNQGDSMADRIMRDCEAMLSVPEFNGRHYVAFISGAGFKEAETLNRFAGVNSARVAICSTEEEVTAFARLSSARIIGIGALCAEVATW
jgi:hypothetical protein